LPEAGWLHVGPSVRVEQLGPNWTDFGEIWYLFFFRKSCGNSGLIKIQQE
jgi:hypothetical protein